MNWMNKHSCSLSILKSVEIDLNKTFYIHFIHEPASKRLRFTISCNMTKNVYNSWNVSEILALLKKIICEIRPQGVLTQSDAEHHFSTLSFYHIM